MVYPPPKKNSLKFQDTKIVQYSNILKSDTPFLFAYILAPKYRTEKFLYSRQRYGSHLSRMCVAREIKQKLCRIFSGHPVGPEPFQKFAVGGCGGQKAF